MRRSTAATCVCFTLVLTIAAQSPAAAQSSGSSQQQPPTHPTATVYSQGYETRLKIHKYASYATIPLFATQLWLGESIYNTPNISDAKKSAHGVVAGGIVGLFAVNTVTGVWNLKESWHDPADRKRRLAHSFLMLAADGGFLATSVATPHRNREAGVPTIPMNESTHRDLAIASIGVASAGYLLMLVHKH